MSVFPHIHTQLSRARNVLLFSADEHHNVGARMHNHDNGFMTIHAMIPGTNRVGDATKDELTAVIDPDKVKVITEGNVVTVPALLFDRNTGDMTPVGWFNFFPGKVAGSFSVGIEVDPETTAHDIFVLHPVIGEAEMVRIMDAA